MWLAIKSLWPVYHTHYDCESIPFTVSVHSCSTYIDHSYKIMLWWHIFLISILWGVMCWFHIIALQWFYQLLLNILVTLNFFSGLLTFQGGVFGTGVTTFTFHRCRYTQALIMWEANSFQETYHTVKKSINIIILQVLCASSTGKTQPYKSSANIHDNFIKTKI